ncbi:MAG: hypothetical protein FJ267_07165 [Planctomycetes bacterium]|nr:hypothetical protein [Planctomycetota bacterium]
MLVSAATSPAKQADVRVVDEILSYFETERRFKAPGMIGVISKIDGLSPVMEWSPPYDWRTPNRPKEKSIGAAVDYLSDVFGSKLSSIVPVCTDWERHRVYGVEEWLVPVIMLHLGEARGCSLVRTLHRQHDQQKIKKVFGQFVEAGKNIRTVLNALLDPSLQAPVASQPPQSSSTNQPTQPNQGLQSGHPSSGSQSQSGNVGSET